MCSELKAINRNYTYKFKHALFDDKSHSLCVTRDRCHLKNHVEQKQTAFLPPMTFFKKKKAAFPSPKTFFEIKLIISNEMRMYIH